MFQTIVSQLGIPGIVSILSACFSLFVGYFYWRLTGKISKVAHSNLSEEELDRLIAYHEASLTRLRSLKGGK